jgi:2-polyprenyl-3-methyl-5-hydroxy-6-metoxy-1,4-benzoquinol methylase
MKHWSQISQDPNSTAAIAARRESVVKASGRPLVKDRVEYLCSLAAGKEVLDVGVVEHTRAASQSPNWLHRRLCSVSKRCLGVDILQEEVEYLKTQGFDVLCHDLTQKPLPEAFDLIVCGELLEHLDAPGLFINNLVQILRPLGKLVLTVPNPWYANVIFKNMFRSQVFVDSVDHVGWFDPWILSELAERNQLQLDQFRGVAVTNPQTLRAKLLFSMQSVLIGIGLKPEFFAKTLIYEFNRTPAG